MTGTFTDTATDTITDTPTHTHTHTPTSTGMAFQWAQMETGGTPSYGTQGTPADSNQPGQERLSRVRLYVRDAYSGPATHDHIQDCGNGQID